MRAYSVLLIRYVDGTPTSEVTPVTIQYIHPPHHGYPLGHSHGHEWSTHIPFVPCQSSLPFLNKAISNFDREPASSRSWMWSKGKTIQSAHYLIDLLSFCFTSIRQQFLRYRYLEIWPSKIKGQGHWWGQRSGSHNSPRIQPIHPLFHFTSIRPTIHEICP